MQQLWYKTLSDYKVYWIHRTAHTDILTEGYVGITRGSVSRRYARHLSNAKRGTKLNPHLYSSLLKYDDIVTTTLCLCDRDYALLLENKLRPIKSIGWNIAVGGITNPYFSAPKKQRIKKGYPDISGDKHPNWQGGIKNFRKFYCLLSESPQAVEERNRKRAAKSIVKPKVAGLNEVQREKLSLARKKFFQENGGWVNPQADKYTWKMADAIYNRWIEDPCGDRALSRKLGMVRNKTIYTMIKLFRGGWIPLNDARWEKFKNEC